MANKSLAMRKNTNYGIRIILLSKIHLYCMNITISQTQDFYYLLAELFQSLEFAQKVSESKVLYKRDISIPEFRTNFNKNHPLTCHTRLQALNRITLVNRRLRRPPVSRVTTTRLFSMSLCPEYNSNSAGTSQES